jgi:prepilin-type N-terminal cleavage/methylation domain-containing protein/prepilin-type processing-associated H-X9-DG protein
MASGPQLSISPEPVARMGRVTHVVILSPHRPGFTLLELVVAISIIGLLAALLIPAVMQSRAAAERMACQSHLKQISLAVSNYESNWRVYPHGLTFRYDLLPYLEQKAVHDARGATDPSNPWVAWEPIKGAVIPVYLCPSDPETLIWTESSSNYAGCFGSGVFPDGFNGMFGYWPPFSNPAYPSGPVRAADVVDGLSNTAALSELLVANGDIDALLRTIYQTPRLYAPNERDALADFCESIPDSPTGFGYLGNGLARGRPWYNSEIGAGLYNHALPPNRPSCNNQTHRTTGVMTAASLHAGGVNVAFGDGHVEFLSDSIDRTTWREIGSRVARVVGPTVP